jgi:hypothetical protein
MSNNDLKLYFLNTITMALSFSNIENALKIILLIASIFYTVLKIIETYKNKKDENK